MPGAPGIVLGFFKIAMGLAHAIRENARDVFPGPTPFDAAARRCATGAALMIHGPIVGSNLVLLLGLIVAWANGQFGLSEGRLFATTLVETSLIAMIGGLFALKKLDSFLSRFLASWVFALGLIVAAVAFIDALKPDFFGEIDTSLRKMSCGLAIRGKAECEASYQGVFMLGLRIFAVQVFCWIAVLAMAVALMLASRWRRSSGQRETAVDLLAPAIGLMTLLWFLFISAIWATAGSVGAGLIPNPDMVASALRGVAPAVTGLLALACVGFVISRKKRELFVMPLAEYMTRPYFYAERYRLLINRSMLGVLCVFLIAVAWISFHAISASCADGLGPWPLGDACAATTKILEKSTSLLLAGLAFLALLALVAARVEFAAGVGVAADVLAYLNDYSWGAGSSDSKTARRHTWLERFLPRAWVFTGAPAGYWLRHRIQDRLKVLMTQLIVDEQPDQIVIVAHSQGTVIALDVIAKEGKGWLQALPKNTELKLVTMGSPYTHLYHHYFPSSFQSPEKVGALSPRTQNDGSGEASLSGWVNIFRIDDFVGTHIGSGCWPTERPVPPNGHTMYWVDRNVLTILQKEL